MAVNAQGTIIEISDDGLTYTSIGCVTSFDISGAARAEIDITCLSSTSKEFIFGLKDNGTMSVEVNYTPEDVGWVEVEASYSSEALYYFQVTYDNQVTPVTGTGTIHSFQGSVTNRSWSGSIDTQMTGTVEIKISGDITEAPAT